jgi:hypothetical protein
VGVPEVFFRVFRPFLINFSLYIRFAVETTKQQNGQSTTSTAPSFSVGGGVILVSRIAGTPIHAGFAVGVDWARKGDDYKYEGKSWIAISIGTNFSSSP